MTTSRAATSEFQSSAVASTSTSEPITSENVASIWAALFREQWAMVTCVRGTKLEFRLMACSACFALGFVTKTVSKKACRSAFAMLLWMIEDTDARGMSIDTNLILSPISDAGVLDMFTSLLDATTARAVHCARNTLRVSASGTVNVSMYLSWSCRALRSRDSICLMGASDSLGRFLLRSYPYCVNQGQASVVHARVAYQGTTRMTIIVSGNPGCTHEQTKINVDQASN
mmetsp:Transcript_17798/g.50438  ORF Transcript_17798/g.50438 Transcript_17798/m.50438 type:complete len:229 (+) Transcript_17798:2425-3111(+)